MSKYYLIDELENYYKSLDRDVSMMSKIESLPKRTQVICKMVYMGDYACPELKDKVQKQIKDFKEKGYEMKIQDSYNFTKVANMLKLSRSTVSRHFYNAHKVVGSIGRL